MHNPSGDEVKYLLADFFTPLPKRNLSARRRLKLVGARRSIRGNGKDILSQFHTTMA
jgi:hypothetical protein